MWNLQNSLTRSETHTIDTYMYVEGLRNAEWVLLDFVDVVVHIFHRAKREHYGLEHLWADAASQRYDNVA